MKDTIKLLQAIKKLKEELDKLKDKINIIESKHGVDGESITKSITNVEINDLGELVVTIE